MQHYDDSKGHILMTVTDVPQLIISQNTVILESHSLVNARCFLRGLSRNDSLLFMYKFKVETRRFRVRFCKEDTSNMSGEEICIKAIKILSAFFPIKTSANESVAAQSTQLNYKTEEKHSDLTQSKPKISSVVLNSHAEFCGEMTLGAFAQAVLKGRSLPLAYRQHPQNLDIIPQLLVMCLADPKFPAFVEAVETAVRAVVDDSL
ncbi:hypothetical protein BsWGS_24272 [Bradybaena similaris]